MTHAVASGSSPFTEDPHEPVKDHSLSHLEGIELTMVTGAILLHVQDPELLLLSSDVPIEQLSLPDQHFALIRTYQRQAGAGDVLQLIEQVELSPERFHHLKSLCRGELSEPAVPVGVVTVGFDDGFVCESLLPEGRQQTGWELLQQVQLVPESPAGLP